MFWEVGSLYDQPGHVIRVWDSTRIKQETMAVTFMHDY